MSEANDSDEKRIWTMRIDNIKKIFKFQLLIEYNSGLDLSLRG